MNFDRRQVVRPGIKRRDDRPDRPAGKVHDAGDVGRRLHDDLLAGQRRLVICRSGNEIWAEPVTRRIGPRSEMRAVR